MIKKDNKKEGIKKEEKKLTLNQVNNIKMKNNDFEKEKKAKSKIKIIPLGEQDNQKNDNKGLNNSNNDDIKLVDINYIKNKKDEERLKELEEKQKREEFMKIYEELNIDEDLATKIDNHDKIFVNLNEKNHKERVILKKNLKSLLMKKIRNLILSITTPFFIFLLVFMFFINTNQHIDLFNKNDNLNGNDIEEMIVEEENLISYLKNLNPTESIKGVFVTFQKGSFILKTFLESVYQQYTNIHKLRPVSDDIDDSYYIYRARIIDRIIDKDMDLDQIIIDDRFKEQLIMQILSIIKN